MTVGQINHLIGMVERVKDSMQNLALGLHNAVALAPDGAPYVAGLFAMADDMSKRAERAAAELRAVTPAAHPLDPPGEGA